MGFSKSEKLKIDSAVSSYKGDVHFFDETVSTNTALYDMGRNGARDGTIVMADIQTHGRGRLGRRWISPRGGNLFMSILFRPRVPVSLCPASTLMASLALCETFKTFGVKPEIKWPNDILVDGKKIAGVLSESEPGREFCDFVVIGIGVNINISRSEIQKLMEDFSGSVTSVSDVLGHRVDRADISSVLIANLFRQQGDFNSKGPKWTVARWAVEWGNLNRSMKIDNNGTEIEGIARKVDENGFLHIETADGSLVKIVSGDAS